MKMFLLTLSLIGLGVVGRSARAAEMKRIDLEGQPVAAAPAEEVKDGIARIHQVDMPQLEVFSTGDRNSHGSILIFPGGGYSILAIDHEGRKVAKMLNSLGWDAAVLLYHVSAGDETKALALADAKKALAFIQMRGADFGLSTKRAGVMGFSAGGHLAARIGHEVTAQGPQFLVLMYPAYLEENDQTLAEVAPPKLPIFIYVAGNDKWSKGAKLYAETCKAQGISCEIYVPEQGGHGFGLKEPLPDAVKDWPDKLKVFLEKQTGGN